MRRVLAVLLLTSMLAHGASRAAKRAAQPDASEEAARSLFVRSDPDQARALAKKALARDPENVRALFVEMEAAALEADASATLESALRLCETRRADPRVNIAGARLLESAANTPAFRAAVPRVRRLLRSGSPQASYLRTALLNAALDGLPGLELPELVADAGIVTRWRIAGPFGKLPNVDWERPFEPEARALAVARSERAPEDFAFLDGNVTLPSYLRGRDGVYYAEAMVDVAQGEVTLRLESTGTALVMLDGERVLVKDDRLRASAQIQHMSLRIAPGTHRLLVKFLPSAEPWRVALTATPNIVVKERPLPASDAERKYLLAADKYWRGDAAAALALLGQPANASEDFLLGRLSAADANEAAAHYRAALTRAPAALAAAYESARYDFEAGRVEDAAAAATRVAALRPDFAPALELVAEAADRLGWDRKALEAYEQRVRLGPSCEVVLKAARLFAKSARYDKARAMEEQARDCAPDSLAYAGALSERGEHAAAAREAQRIVQQHPLDREARALLVEELRLAGDAGGSAAAAAALARIAPARAEPAPRDDDFYLPYRRDGLALARATASRKFSGGPVVELLSDKAVRLNTDGSVEEYVHKLTRVLNKEGIDRYGEVTAPPGAELLELRTVKADGSVVEPELHQHKASISMPALAPGDVIELEYVAHRPSHNGLAEYPASFRAAFGSFRAPILVARFVVELPLGTEAVLRETDNTRTRASQREGFTVRTWEANDLPQSLREPAMAGSNLPTVAVLPPLRDWEEVRDHYREMALAATQVTPALAAIARGFRGNEEERARQVVAYVQSAVATSAGDAFGSDEVPTADETLANGEGSRTSAALALATAARLEARLVLARKPGASSELGFATYTRPLVEFVVRERGREHTLLVDAESDGLAFGTLPADVAAGQALEVPLRRPRKAEPLIALSLPLDREENVATADLELDHDGNAAVRMEIRLGSHRGAQMRETLRGMGSAQRQQLFEQVAARIFPGATAVTGAARNAADLEQPLILEFRCSVPRLLDLERLSEQETLDVGQLVPALGLKRMYASAATRRFPLLVEEPLFETTTFRLHLPEGVRVAQRARDTRLNSEFGSYEVGFRQPDARTLEVRRGFRIPAQVIAPAAYPAFARFAAQIEGAERERLSLARAERDFNTFAAAR